ncbi:MAG TPA: bifunctional precorrin-2 dehydrogenase/sirohydrochlorin ferrochelatase [Chryseosolibacter sp.]
MQTEERNNLFPIFLKLDQLETLIVGGGNVGLEKLTGLLKSSPGVRVTLVADRFHPDVRLIAKDFSTVKLVERKFRNRDLAGKDLLILATDDRKLHERIRVLARKRRMIINVADTPELCDFYLGSVVTKGNIKIGISTNGKSPTIAKRMREFFEEVLPENTNELLDNMQKIRDRIKGDFRNKVDTLNQITSSWLRR